MQRFGSVFSKQGCSVIGMIHIGALPGTPKYKQPVEKLIESACLEAEMYKNCEIDGVLIENMHDVPYVKSKYLKPETTAIMTKIACEVQRVLPPHIPCGIQVLAGANEEALAIAKATNLKFVRAEGFVFGHIADEGYIDACAGNILRYRRSIDADDILVFADIKKKHSSHSITSDVNLMETAKAAEFFLADGVILTGVATGDPTNPNELLDLKKSIVIPILIGSGVTINNIHNYIKSDAVIIGSHFKKGNMWYNDLCYDKIKKFMEKIHTGI